MQLTAMEHLARCSSSNSLVFASIFWLCTFFSTYKSLRSMDCRSKAISTMLFHMSGIVENSS